MSEKLPITTAQIKLLQAEYTRLKKEDDPRTHGPRGETYPDTREGRIAWAKDHLGVRAISSFNDLTLKQGEYLIDTLTKGINKTKLDEFIWKNLERLKVLNPDAWFEAVKAKRNLWTFGGGTLHTLTRYQKYKLSNILSTRNHAASGSMSFDKPGSPFNPYRTRPLISEEQSTLWGGM